MASRLECGCSSEAHDEAERRIAQELSPWYRDMIEPRSGREGPHDYIARYWASPVLQAYFARDLEAGVFKRDR